jgi:hypothetical protein
MTVGRARAREARGARVQFYFSLLLRRACARAWRARAYSYTCMKPHGHQFPMAKFRTFGLETKIVIFLSKIILDPNF